jgi:hypothetical protein
LAGSSNGAATQNTLIGGSSGVNNTGSANTFLGYNSGRSNKSGGYNVFIGLAAGLNNQAGGSNVFLGSYSGASNNTGNYNLFIGNSAGESNNSGTGNTFIGDGSGRGNTSGNRNVYIGQYTGYSASATNSDNVFIGYGAGNANNQIVNGIAIGANAQVTASNSLILGNGVNVGIGTSAPNNKLEIVSNTGNTSGLRLTNLKSNSPVTITTTKYLTVDANGDVVLGSASGSGRITADDMNWIVEGSHLKNANIGGVVIGPGVQNTPVGYRLYVSDGILTEKVKVAVKSTDDWSDRVFEDSYRLRTLSQVERFISKNKHLPGVPSAQEVVEKGVDVGQMQAKLLEKVEELTLYVIDLKKENEKLRKRSKELEYRINKVQAAKK